MSRGVVLVTGINGFVATYTALAFLDAGYTVRGTARTAVKAIDWIEHFPAHKAAYQHAVVADFGVPGAFDDAVKGCDLIVHVASPNIPQVTDNEADVLIPAIRGTRNLLDATKTEPRIRRVVFTSTLAAVVDTSQIETGKVYTEKDWNPGTYDEAKVSSKPRFVYGVSKALAERVFWDYIKDEQPAWAGTSILPCGVFDPPIQPLSSLAALNRSVGFLWDIARGVYKAGLDLPAKHASYVSARDVALVHLRAAERDAAKGRRYLLVGGSFTLPQLVDIIARNFPALAANLPPSSPSTAQAMEFDTAEMRAELGVEFMGFERVVVDTIGGVLELEKKLEGGAGDSK
ncbi:NAD-P-binding protein [Mycena galericulata]|nr:NAD-P-binding protein [Mycena galericulata]